MASIGLQTGLSALLTSQSVLDTIGHNIANANTPGYSRQRVDISRLRPLVARGLLIGAGVGADEVQRTVDDLLQRRILSQVSGSGRLSAQLAGMSEAESLLAEPGGYGLGALLDGFFQSASSLSGSPQDTVLATGLAQAGLELTGQFHSLSKSLQGLRTDTASQLDIRVGEVNQIAQDVARLNVEIGKSESSGLVANDLRDQRDLALENLADLVDFTTQEANNGAIAVLVAGNMLVSPTKPYQMVATTDTSGNLAVKLSGAEGLVSVKGGSIAGLLKLSREFIPGVGGDLDLLARNLILAVNRAHSTGVPAGGPFTQLVSEHRVTDADGDGSFTDERLADLGLPFEITSGELYVNVTEASTGAMVKHRIDVDPQQTTLGELIDALNAVPQISAGLDGLGRLTLLADAGYGFDFSPRLDTEPDPLGSFGGGQATLSSAGAEPFVLADGQTLDLTVLPGATPVSIAFDAADFGAIASATAEELAAAINADAGAQGAGLTASAALGRLVLQTAGAGASTGITVAGGSALSALGWAGLVGSTIAGSDTAVDVQIGGAYTGPNGRYTFVPTGDGVIGTTPGLTVQVFDEAGKLVSTLDVGLGYQPGTSLDVADGVTASFGLGDLSATANDFFAVDVVSDGDSSDLLVAFGLNSFLTGTDAESMGVREALVLNSSLISTSQSGAAGDNGALLDLLDVEETRLGDLGNLTLGERYGQLVGDVGFDVASTQAALQAGESLRGSLELRRESISGVNVDEELVDLLRFEQNFQAASEFINTMNRLNDELMQIL